MSDKSFETGEFEPAFGTFDPRLGKINEAYIPKAEFTPDELREANRSSDDRSIGYARATGGFARLSGGYYWVNGEIHEPGRFDTWLRR